MEDKLLVANWKLHHSRSSAQEFFAAVLPRLGTLRCEIAVAPVSVMLDFAKTCLKNSPVKLAAQNVYHAATGAFTGECSAEQLAELKVDFCIVGHSERRALFGETDDEVAKKTAACNRAGITPIVCVGETLKEREAGDTMAVIDRQLGALESIFQTMSSIVVAYEPIWAIGTGKTATAREIEEVHSRIRQLISGKVGTKRIRILYGGSVSPHNIGEISALPHVDGVLVGGASLQPASFLSMVEKLHGAE